MGGMTDWVDRLRIRVAVVAGAAANTDIPVTGITTKDVIIGCIEFVTAASITTMADRTSITNITSDGNIQTTSSTASNSLFVIWLDRE